MLLPLTLLLAFLSPVIYAFDVQGIIQWNAICPSLERLGPSFATLDSGKYSAPIRADGQFLISNVPPGTYLLSILTHDFYFDQFRIDIAPQDTEIRIKPFVQGTLFGVPSAAIIQHPITLSPKHEHDFYLPPPNFNVLGTLQSPMVLIMVFGGALVLGLPYLMKHMDLEDLQKAQAELSGMRGHDSHLIHDSPSQSSNLSNLSQTTGSSRKAQKAKRK